jgi:RNA polymerase sigma-70 factor (ECF subfamily)
MKGTQIADARFWETQNSYRETGRGIMRVSRAAGQAAGDIWGASDEELALRLKVSRDEGAFNEIVDRYAGAVFMVALRTTLDAYDAGEVLQEAFLSIEAPDSFREGMKFTTWFYGKVLRLCFDRLGAEKNNKRTESPDEYPPFREHRALERVYGSRHTGFSDAAGAEECLGKIGQTLGEMPAGYRAVFQLVDVEGLGDREAAEILGLSVEGVRTRIRRARFFLTERLSDHFYRPEGSRRAEAG